MDHPVAVDNDYEIWNAFANRAGPALYLVDANGIICGSHLGEGRYGQSERLIERLLGVEPSASASKGSAYYGALGFPP